MICDSLHDGVAVSVITPHAACNVQCKERIAHINPVVKHNSLGCLYLRLFSLKLFFKGMNVTDRL